MLFFALGFLLIAGVALVAGFRWSHYLKQKRKERQHHQHLLESVYNLSYQGIGVVDEHAHLISSNLTLKELVSAPQFDYEQPVWAFAGWSEVSKNKVQQALEDVKKRGIVRFEGELIDSRIGPAVFDITIKKLPNIDNSGRYYLFEGKDITAKKQAEKQLLESEARFRTYYDLQPVMMLTVDEHDIIQAANKFTAELLGYSLEQLLGHKLQEFYCSSSQLTAQLTLGQVKPPQLTESTTPFVVRREIRYLDVNKRTVWIRENIRQIPATQQLLIVGEDISEMHLLAETLDFQAHHDLLTSLYNRNHFEQELARALLEVKQQNRSHGLLYLDLDQFKLINDTVGHEAGDAAIIYSAQLLTDITPPSAELARTGGDEFAILLRDTNENELIQFAQKVLHAFKINHFTWNGIHFNLNCSIGLRLIDHSATSTQQIHAQVDTACHLAKEEGRNRAHLYRADDENLRHRELEMECVNQVYDALAHDRVDLYAQPIIDLATTPSENMYFEVLVRLRDKDNRLISPGIFMPAIERYNLAHLIDRAVFEKTLTWFEARPEIVARLARCSINLSGQSMGDKDFVGFLIERIKNTSLPTSKLCIEITETAAVGNMKDAMDFFTQLKALGCMIALDDFGSGLSSFAYLKTLPLDIVKIDGCFVRDMHQDEMDRVLVKSIHDLVKQLGKKTVAEFVENEEILAELISMEVDYAQGYLISEPLPLEQLVKRMMNRPVFHDTSHLLSHS
ncbi:EAL domain-containing protein [Vibrio aphrogenes]|uniref:EAL domain-containing protein n=1 Tax=Vibrio aphrogenes TaxID=1891186 RepID=UPI0013DEF322|nr:EAL domain-containing protein [Vibrio aphrogenes]